MVFARLERLVMLLFYLWIIQSLPSSVHAGNAVAERQTQKGIMKLSLEEGKLMVLQKNLNIAIEKINPQIEETRIEGEKGVFDPLLSGSLEKEDTTTPFISRSSVAAGGRDIAETQRFIVNTGISGKTPLGTEYAIEIEDIKTKDTFNEFQAEYDSFAGIRVTQPLLKDFGSDVNRFEIHIAQINKEISISDLKQEIIDVVADFKNAYWDLVFAINELEVQRESLKLAESLFDLSRKRLKAEVISPLDVTQAEAGVASRRENVIIAERVLREKENALKKLITDDVYGIKGLALEPTDVPAVTHMVPELENSMRDALADRPDYGKLKIEMERNDITIQYAENQKFPRIDLEGTYGYNGLSDTFEGSLKELDGPVSWSVGVIARFPLGNRAAKSDLRIAKLEASQTLLDLKKLEQDIMVEIDNAITEIKTNRDRVEATMVSTRLAEEALRAEEKKLNAGLSTNHNVLDFQEDLTRAKSREIKAIIDYNKSQIEFSRVKGSIIAEEGILLTYK